jgi:hypothetical protein
MPGPSRDNLLIIKDVMEARKLPFEKTAKTAHLKGRGEKELVLGLKNAVSTPRL